MTPDTLARARAALADLRNADMAREPWLGVADVAAAAVALVGRMLEDTTRWGGEPVWAQDSGGDCEGCGRWPDDAGHADDCPALALDAAISRLAGDA